VLDDTTKENKLVLHSPGRNGSMVEEQIDYDSAEPLALECQHFLESVATGERPRTDANNAYQVVRILADVEKRLSSRPATAKATVPSR
jgi:predicted dehydrogenase